MIRIPVGADVNVRNAFVDVQEKLKELDGKPSDSSALALEVAALREELAALKRAPLIQDYRNVMGASGGAHAIGLTPDTPNTPGTSKFLREDGTWETPTSITYPDPADDHQFLSGDGTFKEPFEGAIQLLPDEEQTPTGAQNIIDINAALHVAGPLQSAGVLTGDLTVTGNLTVRDPSPIFHESYSIALDDMTSNGTTSGTIGDLGWQLYKSGGGALTQIAGEANHPGINSIAAGTSSGDIVTLYLNNTAYTLLLDNLVEAMWIVKPEASTQTFRCEFTTAVTGDHSTNNIIGFEHLNTDTNWFAYSKNNAGTVVRTDTTVALANSWIKFQLKRTSGSWEFYINDVLRATHTFAQGPLGTTPVMPHFQIKSAAQNRYLYCDYFRMTLLCTR